MKLFQVQGWKNGELIGMVQGERVNDSDENARAFKEARALVLETAERKGAMPLDEIFVCTEDSERFLLAAAEKERE